MRSLVHRIPWALCCVLCVFAFGTTANAAEPTVAEELLDILKASGQIDETQYDSLLVKVHDEERARTLPSVDSDKASWTDNVEVYGDFRGRHEYFNYDKDSDGTSAADDRTRLRYRVRLGVKAKINDYFSTNFRVVTGTDHNSANQTVGGGGDNWDKNSFELDKAYLTYKPYGKKEMPASMNKLEVKFGKMGNLFRSKQGKDYSWDSDINPEGLALTTGFDATDNLKIKLNTAYFIEDENSSSSDPNLIAAQLVADLKIGDKSSVGTAASYYSWHSLDNLLGRVEAVPGGLTNGNGLDFVDVRLWASCKAIENWPLKVYGNFWINTDAEKTAATNNDKEDQMWMVGVEGGSAKKNVKLGLGYGETETNSTIATLADSDFLDGKTNRKGYVFYAKRKILKNTSLSFTAFKSEELDDDIDVGLTKADRLRFQTNIVVKF